MTKGRLLTFWAASIILAYIFVSQDWYSLSMATDGKLAQLASYDGLTAYSYLSPLLMLNFAGVLVVSFVGSLARKITLAVIILTNLATLAWTIVRVAAQDVSGLSKQVEMMTGIAATHGVTGLTVTTQNAPVWFLVALSLITAAVGTTLMAERTWPKRVSKTETPTKQASQTEPKDAIGIWDSQRR